MRGDVTGQIISAIAAGDTILVSSSFGNSSQSVVNVRTKRKEAQVLFAGIVRVVYTVQASHISYSSSNIAVNGTLGAGSGVLMDTSAHIFTYDIPVNYGDLIQVWAITANLDYPITVSNFSVKFNMPGLAIINL